MDRLNDAVGLGGEEGIEPVQADVGRLLGPAVALPFAPDPGEEERQAVGALEPAARVH